MAKFITGVLKFMAVAVTSYALLFAILVLILIGMAAAFSPKPEVIQKGTVLVLDLGFAMPDTPTGEDPMQLIVDALNDQQTVSIHLLRALQTLEEAAKDSRISALLVTGNVSTERSGSSFAALRELRDAIRRFGDAKPVYAYMDFDGLRDLYVKSAAEHKLAHPRGFVDFRGFRAEYLYLGEAFDRIGIEYQLEQLHDFKTVGETLVRKEMSDEERLQTTALIEGLWASIVETIAGALGTDRANLDAIANENLLIADRSVFEFGFAERAMTREQLIDELLPLSEWDDSIKSFRQIDFVTYANRHVDDFNELFSFGGQSKVAVVYLEGMIVDGAGGENSMGSTDFSEMMREVRDDDAVKAVVIRINSPGGSSVASTRMTEEIRATNAIKPVIVSMGGIATSGGYMTAAAGDYIFVEPTTITGSIGVASIFFNVKGLTDKLSVYFDGVETHRFAGSFMPVRPMDEEELRQRRDYSEKTYFEFVSWVAEDRGMTYDEVDAIARGRVWIGSAAVDLGLADAFGGLQDAIKLAAGKAGMGDAFDIMELPRAKGFEERLMELLQARAARPAAILNPTSSGPVNQMLRSMELEIQRLQQLNDPHHVYTMLPYHIHFN